MTDDSTPHDLLVQYTHATPEAAVSSSPDQHPAGSSRAQQSTITDTTGPSTATSAGVSLPGELGWGIERFEAGFSEGFAAGQRLALARALGSGIDVGDRGLPVDWTLESVATTSPLLSTSPIADTTSHLAPPVNANDVTSARAPSRPSSSRTSSYTGPSRSVSSGTSTRPKTTSPAADEDGSASDDDDARSAATSASGTGGGSLAGEEQQVILHHPDGRLKTKEELRKERKRFTNRASAKVQRAKKKQELELLRNELEAKDAEVERLRATAERLRVENERLEAGGEEC